MEEKKLKAMFFNGSPRKNKNTADMLQSAMHGAEFPYLCIMETFNIALPTSWAELSEKQLLMVYGLFARDLSAAEVKTLWLAKSLNNNNYHRYSY